MLVIGDKEAEQGTVSPRARSGQNLGAMDLSDFIRKVQAEAVPGYKNNSTFDVGRSMFDVQ